MLRAGYSQAVRRARALQVPIVSSWLRVAGAPFHVYVSESNQQVSVLVVTPQPLTSLDRVRVKTEPTGIFAIKVRDEEEEGYDLIEATMDACEDVANALQTISIKNA